MTKFYIGYIRVSDKRRDTSLPAQKSKLYEYAKSNNLVLEHIFVEEGSAYKGERKVFEKMLNELAKDEVKGVIFHKLDRSSRNMRDFARLETFFETKSIICVDGEFDTSTAQGKFMFRIFCSVACWYSDNLSEELGLKVAERLKNGYFPRKAPIGYRRGTKQDGDRKKVYPNCDSIHVKRMFQLYDTGTFNYRSLAAHMRKKGIFWCTKSTVENILTNPFYYGMIKWNNRKKEETTYYIGNHEPLITKELFDRVLNRRENRSRNNGDMISNPYAQFVECTCKRYLTWEKPRNGSGERKYSYLRCHNKDCSFTAIREEVLIECILTQLRSYILRLKYIDQMKRKLNFDFINNLKENKQELSQISLRIAQINVKIDNIEDGFLSGVFDSKEAIKKKAKFNEEKIFLELRQKEIEDETNSTNDVNLEFLSKLFNTLSECYKSGDVLLRKQIISLLFSNGRLVDRKLVLTPSPELRTVASFSKIENGGTVEPDLEKRLKQIKKELSNETWWRKIRVLSERLKNKTRNLE